ncbi:MAG: PAS domain S-box protein, partial [Povalibacter sp.]
MKEFQESTSSAGAANRFDFLVALDDATRPLIDASQITLAAATQLGRYLHVNRCAYADVESDEDTFNLTGNYTDAVQSIVGRYTFTQFGAECLRLMRAGEPYVVEDSHSDPRTVEVRESYRMTEIRSVICVPLLKSGRFVAAMAVHQKTPRQWLPAEIELVQLVASRCWESIERARVARQLRDARDRLQAALSAGEIATWVWHMDQGLIVGDSSLAALFGQQSEEITLTIDDYLQVVHPEDIAELREATQRCIDGTTDKLDADYRFILQDGSVRFMTSRGRAETDGAGRKSRMAGVLLDVTSRKRVEEELRTFDRQLKELNQTLERKVQERTEELLRSERQFAQLVEGVTDCAIYMLDREGYVSSWNTGAERIKGYTAEEIIGRHFSEFYVAEDRAAGFPARSLAAVASSGKFESEGWRVRKDGTRFWASVLIDPIYDSHRRLLGYVKITRDMTERRAMQEQLNQSQKMEAIGQLTGGVAHDFNNLLTVIIGNLDTIVRNAPEQSKLRRAAEHATRGAERAALLTQQLLAFARRQSLNPKPTDVNVLVASMSDMIGRALPESIEMRTVLTQGVWSVEVDANQLENALLNLAVNARDAMPNGGQLTIETSNFAVDAEYVRRFAEPAVGEYAVISVSDTGSGMSEDVIARAFDPFFTTKPIGQGTGLGLSQVFGFVKQSGGHVRLYSEVGAGTTARIYLPRLSSAAHADTVEPIPQLAPGDPRIRILVVDDEEDVRAYSVECLSEVGFTVYEAKDGPAALAFLAEHPEVQLLFSDVGLPGMSGRELAEQALVLRPHLRVLFTTGYARNAVFHGARLDAGVDLLAKPFTRAQLVEHV